MNRETLIDAWGRTGSLLVLDGHDLESQCLTQKLDQYTIYIPEGLEWCCNPAAENVLRALSRAGWSRLAIASTPGADHSVRSRAGVRAGLPYDVTASPNPMFRVPHGTMDVGMNKLLIFRKYPMSEIDTPMPGVVAATRTSADPGHLVAWLDYYLRFCETAAIVVHLRPGEDAAAVLAVMAPYGDRVVHAVYEEAFFDNIATLALLQDLVASQTKGDCVIHLDRDEFIDGIDQVRAAVLRMRSGKSDYATGWMACRLAPGCHLYPPDLPSREAFLDAAPVRSCVIKEYHSPHFKVWLARWPHIRLHQIDPSDHGWVADSSMLAIDHFRWTSDLAAHAEAKAFAFLVRHRGGNVGHWAAMEAEAIHHSPAFVAAAKRQFHPLSARLNGWFNYEDVYRRLVDEAADGDAIVEVGVWCGRSLGYLAEYAQLCGKRLAITGYDQFDPAYRLGTPEPGLTSDSWLSQVRAAMEACAPWNPPTVERGDSSAAAHSHADGSLFAVWLDAGHTKENVLSDVRAWLPKVRSGGILAGHDLADYHPGVRQALDELGISYLPISESSWIHRVP